MSDPADHNNDRESLAAMKRLNHLIDPEFDTRSDGIGNEKILS